MRMSDRKEYDKKYYAKNKETIKERQRKYHEKMKHSLAWVDKRNETTRKYYKENKEAIIEKQSKYKKKNKEVGLCSASKVRAKQKNLPFNLTSKYIKEIWPEDNKCPALGIDLKKGEESGTGRRHAPSLDRIIPELGYMKGNVQIVSLLANQIMSDATPDQVIMVGEHFKKVTEELENEKAF
jgi:hypothetical protein